MTWAVYNEKQRKAVEEIVKTGSDRIIAIVGGALLDDTLRWTICERLKNDADTANKLFRVNGALGNADPKVDLLWLLNGVERTVRNTLYRLIAVRNGFAHALDASFDSPNPKMADGLALLKLQEGKKYYPHHLYNQDSKNEIETVKSNRDRFVVNLKLCLIALMRDRVSHEAWSHTPLSEDDLRKQMEQQRA